MIWVLFASFLILLASGIPVAFCLGVSSVIYFVGTGMPMVTMAQRFFAGIDSFTLLCVPGFILAGNLMNSGGITDRIIGFCNKLVGHIRGSLGLANIVASMIFAGISGTAVADAASIGGILIPAMIKEGYEDDFSVGVTAASSCIGPIIPPSLPMIIAATLTGLSVSKMFVAGILPGILMGVGMMIVSYIISCKRNHPKHEKATRREILHMGRDAFWALLMTFIILVGIISGLVTPTEAAIVAVIYALIIGKFVYRELTFSKIVKVMTESAVTTTSIMVLVGFANLFAYILSKEQIPQMIADALLGFTRNPYVILLLINLLLLFVGCFMETIAALLILFPTLLQVAIAVGINPIHFGIIVVLNLVLGLTTPPVGVCLFVTSSIGKISLAKAAKGVLPFLLVNLFVLLLVTYIPWITLAPVKLIFGNI